MYISLNENEDADRYLNECDIRDDSFYKLKVIARHFLDEGYTKKRTREMLCEYISRSGESPSLNYWADMIDTAVKKAVKHKAIVINSIPIYQSELDKIDSLDGTQLRRLAFTLLCLAKYRDAVDEKSNHWICFEDKDIMKMANVKTSLKRQGYLYRCLEEAGYLRFPKKNSSISMQVLIIDEDGTDPVINITNYKNLGYQYLKYRGEPYFECECCGSTVKRKPGDKHHQKYCDQCAALIQAKQKTEYVMRLKKAN